MNTTVRLASALSCLLLAACQMTTFAVPPLAAEPGCDPGLVGSWRDFDEDAADDAPPEIVVHVDAACRLTVDEHKDGAVRSGDPVQLHVARHGKHRYAWVDAGWFMTRFDEQHRFPNGDVVVMRYSADETAMILWNTDDKAIAHAVIDDELTGEVIAADNELFVRLTGDPDPAVLERDHFFDGDASHFRRLEAR